MGIRWLSKWLLRKVESSEYESAWELSSAGNFLRTMEGTQMITNCGLVALFFIQPYPWLRNILQIWFWRGYIFSLEGYALFQNLKISLVLPDSKAIPVPLLPSLPNLMGKSAKYGACFAKRMVTYMPFSGYIAHISDLVIRGQGPTRLN